MKRIESVGSRVVRRSTRSLFLIPMVALLAAGCSDEESPPGQQQTPLTNIRVLHLSPTAPAVDVFANQGAAPVVESLDYLSGTDYLSIPAGSYDFDVAAAGQPASAAVLSVPDLALAAGKFYTAVAFDELSAIKPLAIEDDFTGLADGNIRVRAIHVASGVGTVDIWNLPAAGAAAKLYSDVPFGGVGEYIDLPAGAYTLGLDVDKDMIPDLTIALPELASGTVANVFAVADAGGVHLVAQFRDGAVAAIAAAPMTRIRVLHLSPSAPAVDVFANQGAAPVVQALDYLSGTEYLNIPAGTYDFDIAASGQPAAAAVLSVPGLALEAGKFYTAVAFDQLSAIKPLALEDDLTGLEAGKIRVRAIHAAAGVGAVDIWNLPSSGAPTRLYSDVPFGGVGDYLDLPAGAYTLGFDVNKDGVPELTFELPALPAGTIANVFAVADSDGVHLAAQLRQTTVAKITGTAMSRIRVLHLSPTAPDVDVFVNQGAAPAVQSLGYLEGTGYISIPAGTYDFDISAFDQPASAAVLSVPDLTLELGKSYTAVAFDALSAIKPLALVDDFTGLEAGKIRVRAIHTAAAVGTVDIWNIPAMGDPAKLYNDVPFGGVGGYFDLPAGAYTLGFDVNEDMVPDVIFDLPALPAGTVANVFAVSDAGGVHLAAQLQDGTVASIAPRL
jgi:hypothetical protein